MSSKKGFTLVELLGVLVVLGLISVIIVPKVIDSITTSKESAYQTQVETIENAAKKYGISNDLLYPKEGEKKYIAVKDLIAVGELSNKEIINPKTGNKMNGYVLVEYNSGYQQYEYTYVEEIDENTLGAMGPTYEVKDPTKWTTSKNVTIIYPKGNGKYEYEYKILAGTVDINGQEYKGETDWIATTELRKNITFKTNGSLIARVKNKDEYVNGSTLNVGYIDNTAPSAALGYDKNTLTTNKIDLVATCTDNESGISKYLFKLGNGNWIDNGTSNKYTFSNLNDSTSYDFSVECINGVGMTSQSTLNSTTSEIGAPTFIVSNPGKWETNKNVTISYPANYTRYEFNIIDGTATRNGQELTPGTWYIASSLEEVVNFTTEGTIVARVYDGTNLKYAVNQAITYVDPTKPTCEILLTGGTLGTNGYYTVAPKVQFKTSIAGGSGIYFGQSKTNSPVYDNSVTKNNSGLINITDVSDGNNTYYGFVKTGVIDMNVTSTCSKTFKVDTTKPVVAINGNASVSYANSSTTITIPLKVTDLTSGIDTNTFTDSDITVKVGTTTVTPTKSLKYNSVSNGVYSYTLTLSGVTGNGALNLSVGAGIVVDKAGNKNDTASISTNVIIDNTAPTLEITETNGTTYKKESDATITLKDTGGSGLTAGSYTIKYGWATSSQTCSNLTSSTTITVAAGATSGSVKVNVKGKTGAGKLYVCNSTSITDRAKNTLSANSVVSSNMYLDNEGPILSDITKSIKQSDSSEYKSAGLDDWTNGYTKLEWNVTEGNSGINRIEYRLNNQTTWSTGGGFTITKNGSTTKYVMERNAQRNDVIYIRVVDNLGNVSEVKSSTLKIDTTKPTWNSGITKYNKNTSSATYTLAGSDDWSLYATKLEWSFNESISGINRIEYRINDDTTWTTSGGFTTSQDGNIYKYVMERTNKRDNLLHLRAVDNAGNVSEEKSIRLRIAYSATIPTNSLCVARTYNGSNQQITSATSGAGYTLSGLPAGRYIVIFKYDRNIYKITNYRQEGVNDTLSSKAIAGTATIGGNLEYVGMTDVIEITNSNINSINMGLIKLGNFDVSIEKSLSRIRTVNPKGKEQNYSYDKGTRIGKLEVAARNLVGTEVMVEYTIKISNLGESKAYISEIIDELPEDLEFDASSNSGWYEEGGKLRYTNLSEIEVGQTREIKLIATIKLTNDNLGIINNVATINATDGNNIQESNTQNNTSNAQLIIGTSTGRIVLNILGMVALLAIIGVGLFIIKKYR